MKSPLLAVVFLAFALGSIFTIQKFSDAYTCGEPFSETMIMRLGGRDFGIEVARTPHERRCGLSLRAALGSRRGLLLVFSEDDRHGMWMKDMRFSLDAVWLDREFAVVDVMPDIAPETYPSMFYPSAPARYILELSAGTARSLALERGDRIQATLFSE